MRHIFNVVSAGMFLGLSLFAISVLTALYASPWQAATILAVLCGIFTSVSLYYGSRAENQTIRFELAERIADIWELRDALSDSQAQAQTLENALARAQVQLHEYGHAIGAPLVIIYLVIAEEIEEEPPLFI